MNATVGSAVRVSDKAGLPDRTILGDEGGDGIVGSVEGSQCDLRIWNRIKLTFHSGTGAPHGRLGVTLGATIAIKRGPQTRARINRPGNRVHFGESAPSSVENRALVCGERGKCGARPRRAAARPWISLRETAWRY